MYTVQLHRCLISFDGLIRSASNLHRPQTCTHFSCHIVVSNVILLHHSTSRGGDCHRHRRLIIVERRYHHLTSTSTHHRLHRYFSTASVVRRVLHNGEGISIIVNHTTKLYVFHRYLLILKRYDPQSCRSHRECHATST